MKRQEQREELPRLIDFREVRRLCGLSRSAVWRLENEGTFPRRRLITKKKVAWLLPEVLKWIAEREPVGVEAKPTHNLPDSKSQQPEARQTMRRPTWMERDDD